MIFKQLNDKISAKFAEMQQHKLFRLAVTGDDIWTAYIKGFKAGDDPVFRDPESTTHTCNNDKNFIRRYGNVVAIDAIGNIISMFDIDVQGTIYEAPINNIQALLSGRPINNVFFETFDELNTKVNYSKVNKNDSKFQLGNILSHKKYSEDEVKKFGVVNSKEYYTFNHFHVFVNKDFVDTTGKSVESIMGNYKADKEVFKRAMDEIPLDTLKLVKDLINQGSLLNGTPHLSKIELMIDCVSAYNTIPANKKDSWCWVNSYKLPLAKFKNELIGVLCTELAEGTELNKACQAWNKRVDPANYMKAVAPITKAQKELAAKKFYELGYQDEHLVRRHASLKDIKVDEILHSNEGDGKLKSVSVFDKAVTATTSRHKRSEFDKVDTVGIDKFMKDILPGCSSVEVFLTSQHEGNLVNLTSTDAPDKNLFAWSNNYSWTYKGNLAGKSQLAKMVEAKGGRIDGVFRFTHSWNELEPNQSLMDLHVFMPGCKVPNSGGGPQVDGRRVGWNHRMDVASGGVQDVDYVEQAPKGYIPVENITFPSIDKMPEGVYTCKIHNWSFRGTGGRGKAEIAFNGEVYQYEYPKTTNHQWVTIAEVTLKDGVFTIDHKLPPVDGFGSSKKIYNLQTNEFHKVNLMCLSPNYWGENKHGNKHYMFMLDGCKTDEDIRGFHNENLCSELLEHRKVMDVLANGIMIPPSDKQLAGLGFNATVPDELIVRLSGSHKRVVKIKF